MIVETFKVKVYLAVSRHYPAQAFRPVLVLAFAWQLFSALALGSISLEFHCTPITQFIIKILKEYCA
jgi:hypothetical protein